MTDEQVSAALDKVAAVLRTRALSSALGRHGRIEVGVSTAAAMTPEQRYATGLYFPRYALFQWASVVLVLRPDNVHRNEPVVADLQWTVLFERLDVEIVDAMLARELPVEEVLRRRDLRWSRTVTIDRLAVGDSSVWSLKASVRVHDAEGELVAMGTEQLDPAHVVEVARILRLPGFLSVVD
ncbi:hypothetical protein F0L68_39285 [Solihabitans fulvus]|uniref:Uncharacterized protein n=1 Tax=Solihabitans fulvus TaxID=1892852 RepID=A0A5B2WF60_9PSEU|nr:hypothetical protein [Solihabitans fulvus]KAA2249538.1 hypothetical protein F0L68_39285 [Solihabitans fulvus]